MQSYMRVIVEAGSANFPCAWSLAKRKVAVLEALGGIRGRPPTRETDCFLLDRGFIDHFANCPASRRYSDRAILEFQSSDPDG